ncbi:hypothetical protein LCGC14_0761720 [marine sediment metagenome]|uniref:Helix-turn-helix domain-containing protein n=1 Tax=marine sediment metagenome TaxID=412755 RepID=A0A0F9T7X0_9ZZZZ|nr:DNA-binding protein [bacterium]
MQKLYSSSEVAKILGVTSKTIASLFKRGHFPNAFKVDPTRQNSPLRFPSEDVESYREKIRMNHHKSP